MTRARREYLLRALLRMVALYGDAERAFARLPLASLDGRRAGRAAARRFAAVERIARALAAGGVR
ncbi:hypothetical protein FHG89_27340 [Micromonospora orduensis]|uniref:Uncharacterized protein n=1 Tax=Micromonospora orduensis TaxID=1420891 RepID=A0A5C4QJJ7_9ACTN|nr:hypothetical protein [Micromonospora orduensis]TNH23308.1 hypothetical protein FHG89_27340 [Micromonospora orduensis]